MKGQVHRLLVYRSIYLLMDNLQDATCTLTRLPEGDYIFKVRALNSLGPGEWSEPVYVSVLEGIILSH